MTRKRITNTTNFENTKIKSNRKRIGYGVMNNIHKNIQKEPLPIPSGRPVTIFSDLRRCRNSTFLLIRRQGFESIKIPHARYLNGNM